MISSILGDIIRTLMGFSCRPVSRQTIDTWRMIWGDTNRVSIGAAYGADGSVYVVGRYTPPGNWDETSAWQGAVEPVEHPSD
jgi:hypothetical protein